MGQHEGWTSEQVSAFATSNPHHSTRRRRVSTRAGQRNRSVPLPCLALITTAHPSPWCCTPCRRTYLQPSAVSFSLFFFVLLGESLCFLLSFSVCPGAWLSQSLFESLCLSVSVSVSVSLSLCLSLSVSLSLSLSLALCQSPLASLPLFFSDSWRPPPSLSCL